MAIKYVKGDATIPQGDGTKIIVHIVNDIGRFGSGFAKAIMDRYPIVREEYMKWARNGEIDNKRFMLGETQFVRVNDDLWFANMIAQHNLINISNPTPIKYDALISCLKQVEKFIRSANIHSLHMPKIGTKRAGGDWRIVEQIIIAELCDNGLIPIVYEYEEKV